MFDAAQPSGTLPGVGSRGGERAGAVTGQLADDVEAVMLAARALVAVTARSVATVDDVVSLPQLRVLVMVASRGTLNLSAVAAGLGVHPSNATRTVDRLIAAGLLDRRDDPSDRRNLILELSPDGRGLVDRVMEDRRAAIAEIVQRMQAQHRRSLVPVLRCSGAPVVRGGVRSGVRGCRLGPGLDHRGAGRRGPAPVLTHRGRRR